MTISNETNRTSVVGNAAVGQVVPFSFPITSSSDLVVRTRVTDTAVEATLLETTNYTVAITGDLGGSVTMVTAVAVTSQIHVERDTPKTQPLDLIIGGDFDPEAIEDAIDKNMKVNIDNAGALGRTIRIAATDSAIDPISNAVDRANKFLAFDANGDPSVVSSVTAGAVTIGVFAETYLNAATAIATRAILGVESPWTYLISVVGGVYYAKASAEAAAAGLSDQTNANYVDLIDTIMAEMKSDVDGGTEYIQGNRVEHTRGLYTLTKNLTIPPTQDFVWDSSMAQFDSTDVGGAADMITIDSCIECRFTFGLMNMNQTTTGATIGIRPSTTGGDLGKFCTVSEFNIPSAGTNGSAAIELDASSGDITKNTFNIGGVGGPNITYGIRASEPGAGKAINGNVFKIFMHDVDFGIKLDGGTDPTKIRNNVFLGNIEGRSGEGDIGLDIKANNNYFAMNVYNFDWGGTSESLIFRSGALGNIVHGYMENGYDDESSGTNVAYVTNASDDGQIDVIARQNIIQQSINFDDGFGVFGNLGEASAAGINFQPNLNEVRVFLGNIQRATFTTDGFEAAGYNIVCNGDSVVCNQDRVVVNI